MATVSKHRGFSLIELLITLGILAVITAIDLPAYKGYIITAREAEGHNNLAALQMAEEEYFLENNSYFAGANYTQLQDNSNGLWTRTGNDDGTFNFTYAVTLSGGGYEAKATHTTTGKVLKVMKQ